MGSLTAAHRGYEYQDLLSAYRLVDLLLGKIAQVHIDEKLFADDRFDDLTTVAPDGRRERTQFKHTEIQDHRLNLATFTTERRDLRLDSLIGSVLTDRFGPGQGATSFLYRIVLRDASPIDLDLTDVLEPIKESDPGPFIAGTATQRLRFNAAAIWRQGTDTVIGGNRLPFRFLRSTGTLTMEDLEWVCQRLVVEVNAPPSSADLTAPNVAERQLLERMTSDVGAESFPNTERSAVDVAAAMISTARAARQGRLIVTSDELLRRAQLKSDFGAVSRSHPVDRELEVLRSSAVQEIVESAVEICEDGGYLVVLGPPGQGKSWICQQALDAMDLAGWLTAEHYCYLGDADGERNRRVLSEIVFGSLISRLGAADPRILTDQRPRFAADEEALERCLRSALVKSPGRKIALFVDGVDHITRVRARMGDRFDPSKSLVESLAALGLPAGVVIIILSQPGAHLDALNEENCKRLVVPGLSRSELEELATHLNVLSDQPESSHHPLLEDPQDIQDFLSELERRSSGNALYATYLCRETLRRSDTLIRPADAVRSLPQFDGTLRNYYEHLYKTLDGEASWVADVVALVDFSLTRVELREIRPDAAHRVDAALSLLAPVLTERAAQGGVRVYHESFARYLRRAFESDNLAMTSLLERIAVWLERKGLFSDPRSFRSLLPLLAAAGKDRDLLKLVDRSFVSKSIAAGFSASAIAGNLAVGAAAAARLGEWSVVVRCVELARAAESCESERLDSLLVAFADVPASLISAGTLADRLLTDDSLAMPARVGLQMCAAVDRLGATAPWRQYIQGFEREAVDDNTHYGEASDQAVALALLRGELRLSFFVDQDETVSIGIPPANGATVQAESIENAEQKHGLSEPIDWAQTAAWVQERNLPIGEVIDTVFDTLGRAGVEGLLQAISRPGEAYLAYAERLAQGPSEGAASLPPLTLAMQALESGVYVGSIQRLLHLGVDPHAIAAAIATASSEQLLSLTRDVQLPNIEMQGSKLDAWLDGVAMAAHLEPEVLFSVEILIVGEGWFRCWLRFAVALAKAEASKNGQDRIILEGMQQLTKDLRPFSGQPRACDLYRTLPAIRASIARAMHLLKDPHWGEALTILKRVRSETTTSLRGAVGGPVTPDYLLQLAVETASPSRYPVAEELIREETEEGAARRYYTDLAEYRLVAARLAIKKGDINAAASLWEEACGLLAAYGYHKDITIYGVLDPLPALIKADPRRGRLSVSAVQAICHRVPLHTDGKSTRGTRSTWWELLAKADPVGAIDLAVPALLRDCNDPYPLLDEAINNVWEEWNADVDPVLAGALRLSLDKTLDPRDSALLQRLIDDSTHNGRSARDLMVWLMSRIDERHVAYSVSNSGELLAKDDILVVNLNKVAVAAGVPTVAPVEGLQTPPSRESFDRLRSRRSDAKAFDDNLYASFPEGLPGLSRAIRLWRRRPYGTESPEWAVERFTNLIGYRLLQLGAEGRFEDAESALKILGQGVSLGEQVTLLRSVGEGLERYGQKRLAAVAFALAWTRSRGGGGWFTFGGESELESLRRASSLDSDAALFIVAEEVEQAIASNYGPYGISQAIIIAFGTRTLIVRGSQSIDVAFAVWDEALAVISARTPRVAANDDPDHRYVPSLSDPGSKFLGNLGEAFALAVLGGLFDPSRERKRRTLLAVRLLVEYFPAVAAKAVSVALSTISDPATIVWLLTVLDSLGDGAKPVLAECQLALRELLSRDLLTVRALARRLVTGEEPPLAPSSVPEPALLPGGLQLIAVDAGTDGPELDDGAWFEALLDSVAGERLQRAEPILPGFRAAVQRRASSSLNSEVVRKRLHSQLDSLSSRSQKRWPDAYLANEETIEGILQSVAAGGRAALLAEGELVPDGAAWEDNLASLLTDDRGIPLLLEATREPRLPQPPPPGKGNEIWIRILDRARGASKAKTGIEIAWEEEGVLSATISVGAATAVRSLEAGRYKGWKWLGFSERRRIQKPDWQDVEDLLSARYCMAEIRDPDSQEALHLPPVASGDLRLWRAIVKEVPSVSPLKSSRPLIGVDHSLDLAGDSRTGLGVPSFVLTPTPALLASLALKPADGFSYHDANGTGLALVTWRAEYDRSEYYLAFPRIIGSGIVIRPDLFDRLAKAAGDHRLVIRDFVSGATVLSAQASP